MELSQTMMWILGILFGTMFSIIGFLLKTLYSRLEAVEKQSDENLKTSNEFKFNYLDRFSRVMDVLTEIKESIAELKGKQSK